MRQQMYEIFDNRERGGREKKETAIITRATGKSENKTCHKINKAKKKLNKKKLQM